MQRINQTVGKVLTETRAPQTPGLITQAALAFNWKFKTCNDSQLEGLLHEAKRFASAMQLNEDAHWLSILGPSGSGKTHISKRLVSFWRDRAGWRTTQGGAGNFKTLGPSRFVSWRKLVDRIRGGGYDEIDGIGETDFVVIDDIGAEHDPSGFAKSILDRIADARLNKWTVWTSNLLLNDINKRIDTRISSRMIRGESVIVELNTKDFNLR